MFAVVRFHNEFQRSLDLQLVGTLLNAAVHQSLWSLIVDDSFHLEKAFRTKLDSPRGGHLATAFDGFEISRIFFALFKRNYTFFYIPVDVFPNSVENNSIHILFTIANARTEIIFVLPNNKR